MILIGLLFAKDYILPPLLKRLGLGNGKPSKVEEKIDDLGTNHLHTISETLKRIEEKLETINDNVIWLKAKSWKQAVL